MEVIKTLNNNELIICLSGRLDAATSPVLEEEVNSLSDSVTTVVLDLERLDYISSSGLRIVLALQKLMNTKGKLIIRNPQESIKEIFDITGFSSILTFEQSEEA